MAYSNNGHGLLADMTNGGPISDEYNSWDTSLGLKVVDADFESVAFAPPASCPATYSAGGTRCCTPTDATCFCGNGTGARNADGSLPVTAFLRLAAASPLIDKGTNVGLPFSGSAPDLGCFETGLVYDPSDGGLAERRLRAAALPATRPRQSGDDGPTSAPSSGGSGSSAAASGGEGGHSGSASDGTTGEPPAASGGCSRHTAPRGRGACESGLAGLAAAGAMIAAGRRLRRRRAAGDFAYRVARKYANKADIAITVAPVAKTSTSANNRRMGGPP